MKVGRERRRTLVCQELVEVITDYLEGALSPGDRARFETHLAGCELCDRYVEQFRRTILHAGRLRAQDLPDALAAELLDAFRGWRG